MEAFNRCMNLDPVQLEAERFGLSAAEARAMLTKSGRLRKRYGKPVATENKTVRSRIPVQKKINIQPEVKTRIEGINLTEAQERAFNNYLEGVRNGKSNDV